MKLRILNTILTIALFISLFIIPKNYFFIKLVLMISFIVWIWWGDKIIKDNSGLL